MTLFVDTSTFYAAADIGDVNHARAAAIIDSGQRLLTSDHVLLESWLLIRRRLGADAAKRYWGEIRAGAVSLEVVLAADLEVAWSIGEMFLDQDFSVVERTSFAVMQRLGLHRATSFDDDYAIYRYGPRRERAFEVIR